MVTWGLVEKMAWSLLNVAGPSLWFLSQSWNFSSPKEKGLKKEFGLHQGVIQRNW
jgi:hypothetical protein